VEDLGVDGMVLHSCVNLEVLTAVIMANTIILDVTPCNVVEICQPFKVKFASNFTALRVEIPCALETFANFYKTDSAMSTKTPPLVTTVFFTPLEKASLV